MLQSMRDNSQGIIAKILVGLIIVVFALWGVDSLVGLATAKPAPAKVNGAEITEQELFRGVELQRRQILNQMGTDADPAMLDDNLLRKSVLEGLIDRTLQETTADDRGLFVSEEMLDQLIVNTLDFQVEGRFDRNQFEARLRSAGFTPLTYRELLRTMTLVDQQRRAYADSAFVTPTELDRMLELNRQTRAIRYALIAPDEANVEISDAELRAAYDERSALMQTPEQLVMDYVLLELEQFSFPDQVSEAELNTAYENLKADFQGQEERFARHILLEVNDSQSAEQAVAKAAELRQQIEAGADFAELAKIKSQDIGSAPMGGELGYMTKGFFAGAFDDALFALNEGEVSEPVTTEFGVHLIKLDSIRQTEAPSFAEAEYDLREQIAQQEAEAAYVVALERLADLAFSSGDLVAASEELGLNIQTSEPFAKSGGEGLFSNQRVIRAANSDTVLKERLNSDLVELDSGRTMVMHLNKEIPARQLTLDDVREDLIAQLKQEKAAKAAAEQADALAKQLNAGETTDLLFETAEAVMRGADAGLPPQLVSRAFAQAKPGSTPVFTSIKLIDGSAAVLTVDAVGVADDELEAEQRQQIARMLANLQGEKAFNAYFEQLKASAEIEIN